MRYLIGYLAGGLAFLALDFAWLSLMVPKLYRPLLEPLLAQSPALAPATAFYLLYPAGLAILAVFPATTTTQATVSGLVFGFAAYATYNLTNAATLKVWPWQIVAADISWGTAATAAASCLAFLALRWFDQS